MYDVEKNTETDVANRAHMIFKMKVDTPLKVNDMLIKQKESLEIVNN